MASIDIILPVYKVNNFIAKCVESIINQTFRDFELIIIDDCGNDNSIELCQKILRKTSIQYQIINNKKNLGLSESRNIGIQNSSSPYILCVDSDDWIDGTMLEKLHNSAINNNADIVSCRAMQYWEYNGTYSEMAKTKPGMYTAQDYLSLLFNGDTSSHVWQRLIKRSLFNHVKFPANVIFEDVLTMPILIKNANKVIQLEDNLYFYRQRKSKTSITGSKPTNIEEFIDYLKASQSEFGEGKGCRKLLFRKFSYKILFYLTFNTLQYSQKYSQTKRDLKAIKSFLKVKSLVRDILVLRKSMKINFILYLLILKINEPLLFTAHKKIFHKWFHLP